MKDQSVRSHSPAENSFLEHLPEQSAVPMSRQIRRAVKGDTTESQNLPKYELAGRRAKLENELSVDQAALSSSIALGAFGLGLAVTLHRNWLALPLLAGACVIQERVFGSSLSKYALGKAGFRSAEAIMSEREELRHFEEYVAEVPSRDVPPVSVDLGELLHPVNGAGQPFVANTKYLVTGAEQDGTQGKTDSGAATGKKRSS